MPVLVWVAFGYVSGSLMFSYAIGRLLRVDISTAGDRNPGAGNLGALAGTAWGVVGAILDILKAAVPVWLATRIGGIQGWAMVPVALAPVVGSVAPPWPKLGGKGLAASFGVWFALEPTRAPVLLALVLAGFRYFVEVPSDGWGVALGSLSLAIGLLLWRDPTPVWTFWAADSALLAWRRRDELAPRLSVHFRPRLGRL
jgi:glycerol-3-phosphate acyltransferase PlsY